MIRLANALLAYSPNGAAAALHGKLLRGGYHGALVDTSTAVLDEIRQSIPDIILIGPTLLDMDGLELARRLRANPATAKIPLFLLVAQQTDEVSQKCLDIGIDDVMTLPIDETVLFARMRPLVRVATMHTELRMRADVAKSFGIAAARDAVNAPSLEEPEVLLAFASPEEADFLRGALDPRVDLSVVSGDLYEVEGMLAGRNFDAAILFIRGKATPFLDLCTQIRNNPRLFNLPVVLIGDTDDPAAIATAYRHGASRVFTRPVAPIILRSAIVPLVRRQRLRWAIRQALADTMGPATQDALTHLYHKDFLDACLSDRVTMATAGGRHVSIILFYFPSVAGILDNFGETAAGHLLRQLGQWVTNLLRAEDLAARLDGYNFCIVLPDTPLAEAQFVMNRIAGVLSHTDFAVPDVYEVVQVWMQTSATELGPDDTPDTLIGRVRDRLG
ncbi:MAG: diguanylate cyclase [Alphaproteobacteria bacterium]|nr:diguanylate cyclase [Alphaproteobacteria bacterium]